jgi:hypothetical protein
MWQSVQDISLLLNRKAPAIRRMLPEKVVEAAVTFLEGATVPSKPDRQYLTRTILPGLAALKPKRVLFVGCRKYTKPYEDFFRGSEYWTLEIDPIHSKWGAPLHKMGDVRHADDLFPKDHFDLILFNGILGFGINSDADMDQAIVALRRVMRPNGILLVGWNDGLSSDPLTRPVLQAGFVHEPLDGIPARTTFADSEHIFDLFRARAPGDTKPTA